jgi:hypothetical protein
MTDEERVARIIARASLVRRAELRGVDVAASETAQIVVGCGVDFLWPDHAGTARTVLEALGVVHD